MTVQAAASRAPACHHLSPQHAMSPSDTRMHVAMLTPWDQVCGNAEYAKRLVRGLATIADVAPHEMRNIGDGYDDDGRILARRDIDRGMRSLVARVRDSRPDIVHIQHEFSFFGRSFREADRRFLRVVSGVRRPVIVTLHTFTQKQVPVKPTKRRHKIARALLFWRKVGDLRRALRRADAIVLHSIHTQRLLVRAFPELRRKIHVVPIAIEPLPRGASGAWQKPAGERWVLLPGFVSAYKGHEHALAAIKRLLRTLSVDDEKYPPKNLQHFINGSKEAGLRASAVEDSTGGAGSMSMKAAPRAPRLLPICWAKQLPAVMMRSVRLIGNLGVKMSPVARGARSATADRQKARPGKPS